MTQAIEHFLSRYSIREAGADLLHLQALAAAFSHLPYENVTKILKHARSSSTEMKLRHTEEVLEDHLRWNTGGTCFSLCNALHAILSDSGFASFIAMADMHYGRNIHCAVIASAAGRYYLLDPGYLLHDPMLLPAEGYETVRQTPMNTVRLHRESADLYSVYTKENDQQKWRYRLRARPVPREEFLAHWIHSFSLNTIEHVMLSRVSESGRLYFRKDRLELVRPQHRRKENVISADTLASTFGLPRDLIVLAQNAVTS